MDFKQSNEEPSVYENLYTFYRRKDYALPRQIAYATVVTTRTGVVEQHPESSLVFFNKSGKVIWSAP